MTPSRCQAVADPGPAFEGEVK